MVKLLLKWKLLFFLVPFVILFVLTAHNALFWDTVQFGGEHPNWYYYHHFRYFLLPDYIDSGHPPAFGMYLALVWLLFGKSLFITHLALLPFVLMIVLQAVRLGDYLFPTRKLASLGCTALILSECVLLTQCTLVSPDIMVMAFFLFAFNAILRRTKWQLVIGIMVLGMMSMRAMMCGLALYVFLLSYNAPDLRLKKKSVFLFLFQNALPFIPGGLLAIAYMLYHYDVKGWLGYHEGSTWAGGFERVPLQRVLRNTLLLGWRLVDLGKIATVVTLVCLLIQWFRGKIKGKTLWEKNMTRHLFVFVLALFLITALPLCLYRNLLMHRYLISLYTGTALLTLFLLVQSDWKYKGALTGLLVIVQLSGHFWAYPRRVPQGWDATLAHLPVYQLRADFQSYMLQHDIGTGIVATSFPLLASDSMMDLKGSPLRYRDFETDSTEYVWYSNVCNAMNRNVGYYFNNWQIVKQQKRGHVEMVLFKRKN